MDVEGLKSLGVHYFSIGDIEGVNKLASERGYKNRDEIVVSPEKMGDVYEEKVKMFFHEHLHEDEEIRYVRDGQGYFDVRSVDDEWVRIRVEKVRSYSLVLAYLPYLSNVFSGRPDHFTTRHLSSLHD